MRRSVVYIIACAVAALMPFLFSQSESASGRTDPILFPGWPTQIEGKTITQLPLTDLEKRFMSDFPGRIGRFSDGKREIVVRWVTEATRKMHPASDCFQGLGYGVKPLPLRRDNNGTLWSSFAASKGEERLRVYERIHSESGETWSDLSAWYWSALSNDGPWWAITIAEKEP
jgi:hypothetical protein